MTPRGISIAALALAGIGFLALRACSERPLQGPVGARAALRAPAADDGRLAPIAGPSEARVAVATPRSLEADLGAVRIAGQEVVEELPCATGTVVDEAGTPLAGAAVARYLLVGGNPALRPSSSVTTDAQGRFALSAANLDASVLLVEASEERPDLLPRTLRLEGSEEQRPRDLGVLRLERGCTVSGEVERRAATLSGERALRVEASLDLVSLRSRPNRGSDQVRWSGGEFRRVHRGVECDGTRFEIVGLDAAGYGLRIDPSCFSIDPTVPVFHVARAHDAVQVTAPARDVFVPLNYVPAPVRVTSEGAEVPGTMISASWSLANGGGDAGARTDLDGRLTVLAPPGLEVLLTASKAGYYSNSITLAGGAAGAGQEATFELERIQGTGDVLILAQRLPAAQRNEELGLWVLEHDGRAIDAGLETALEQMAADGAGFHWRSHAPSVVWRRTEAGGVRLFGMPAGAYVLVAAALTNTEEGGSEVGRIGGRLRFTVLTDQTTVVR